MSNISYEIQYCVVALYARDVTRYDYFLKRIMYLPIILLLGTREN